MTPYTKEEEIELLEGVLSDLYSLRDEHKSKGGCHWCGFSNPHRQSCSGVREIGYIERLLETKKTQWTPSSESDG